MPLSDPPDSILVHPPRVREHHAPHIVSIEEFEHYLLIKHVEYWDRLQNTPIPKLKHSRSQFLSIHVVNVNYQFSSFVSQVRQ